MARRGYMPEQVTLRLVAATGVRIYSQLDVYLIWSITTFRKTIIMSNPSKFDKLFICIIYTILERFSQISGMLQWSSV